jgi:hypothetical protein
MSIHHNNLFADFSANGFLIPLAEVITLAVAPATTNRPMVLSGTVLNTTTSNMDYTTNGGATWTACTSFVQTGTNWTALGPTFSSAGNGNIQVRDHNAPLVLSNVASFTVSAPVTYPDAANLIGWFYTNSGEYVSGTGQTQLVDHSPLNLAGTLQAAPVLSAGYMSCGAPSLGQYLQTQVIDPGTDYTIACIFRTSDTILTNSTSPKPVTNQASNNVGGVSGTKSCGLSCVSPTSLAWTDTENNPAGTANQFNTTLAEAAGVIATWGLYAQTIATTGSGTTTTTRTAYDLTRGIVNVNSRVTPRVPNTLKPYQVGGTLSPTVGGIADVAFVAWWNTAWAASDLTNILRPFLATHLTPLGVTGW